MKNFKPNFTTLFWIGLALFLPATLFRYYYLEDVYNSAPHIAEPMTKQIISMEWKHTAIFITPIQNAIDRIDHALTLVGIIVIGLCLLLDWPLSKKNKQK